MKSKNGESVSADLSLGHIEGGYSADYTPLIPKYSIKAGADTAKFKAQIKATRSGLEHDLGSFDLKGPGAGVSADVGGITVLPKASLDAHVYDRGVSVGLDKLSANLKGDVSGNVSAGLSGIGAVTHGRDGSISASKDIGRNTLESGKGYLDTALGKSGSVKGTAAEIYTSGHNRNSLMRDAERQHRKCLRSLKRLEGREDHLAARRNDVIADKSRGYIDRLDSAIDQAKLMKTDVDGRLKAVGMGSKEADTLSHESEKLGKSIEKMTAARDNLESDRLRANAGRERNGETARDKAAEYRSTEQITGTARANADDFQNAVNEQGIGNHLAQPAVNLCDSRNELNGRISRIDRGLAENNNDINAVGRAREDYLSKNGLSMKDAVEKQDPRVMDYNSTESRLRSENESLREEKGECQKALLETDKNFMPGEASKGYEEKDRALKSDEIDNKNALTSKDDDIANYCNEHGIEKNKDGSYVNAQNDEGLDQLLKERNSLEKHGDDLKADIDQNKKDLAESEKDGKSSLKVNENEGCAEVRLDRDDYKAHAQDNKDLRYKPESEDEGMPTRAAEPRQHEPSVAEKPELKNSKDEGMPTKAAESRQHEPGENTSQGASNGMPTTSAERSSTNNNGRSNSDRSTDKGAENSSGGISGNSQLNSVNQGISM
ncbi:MAG: hypothetical protein Q4E57_02495 [Eubacteriales bacterium]|nr:hypothetical protein [Eubacteriales bacterium]